MKEKERAIEIKSLISGEIFNCLEKAMIIAKESEDDNLDFKQFIADCGLAYINLHEQVLIKHIYSRYPELGGDST